MRDTSNSFSDMLLLRVWSDSSHVSDEVILTLQSSPYGGNYVESLKGNPCKSLFIGSGVAISRPTQAALAR
jgi:hypothetical protein